MSHTPTWMVLNRGLRLALNKTYSRRNFIRNSVLAVSAFTLPASCLNRKPNITIIGGGLSGLNTGFHLKNKNLDFKIYEATGRTGGRTLTVDQAVTNDSYVDFGAEYVDTTHDEVIELAKSLNLELIDLKKDQLIPKTIFFQGKHLSAENLAEVIQPFAEAISTDIDSLPDKLHYENSNAFRPLDELSISDYLTSKGITGWLFDFFEMNLRAEYAMECTEQSALNLLSMFVKPETNNSTYDIFGDHHEVLKIKGGTGNLAEGLTRELAEHIQYNHILKAIKKTEAGYSLHFDTPDGQQIMTTDILVMTIPFAVLKEIKLNFDFPERKAKAIAELGFGNGTKTAMGFNKKIWRDHGHQGYTLTDVNHTVFWDSSQGQKSASGSLTFIGGGNSSEEFNQMSYAAIKSKWLSGAEQIFPGLTPEHNNQISKYIWSQNPFARGSYTSYKKGQWSTFAGVEAEPFENILFAGEHCSTEFQGYMNGALESGRKAAMLIIESLNKNI
jgi:monoamine oxidase